MTLHIAGSKFRDSPGSIIAAPSRELYPDRPLLSTENHVGVAFTRLSLRVSVSTPVEIRNSPLPLPLFV